jgi:hypothetical protein
MKWCGWELKVRTTKNVFATNFRRILDVFCGENKDVFFFTKNWGIIFLITKSWRDFGEENDDDFGEENWSVFSIQNKTFQ